MALSVPIDTREITITPVFKHITVEDIAASEREKRPVMKTIEAVEVRFAGSKLYSPVFPVDAMWKREGHNVITYAERWADQYTDFLQGNDQKAAGTPLEMLKPLGISDAQLSLCRALKIYSIEALDGLEGPNLKNLQMNANPLKEMARRYLADRNSGNAATNEIAELRAEIERLRATQSIPPKEPTAAEVEEALRKADDEYTNLSDDELKALIKDRTGSAPRGQPAREFLLNALRELDAA
ncbi:MAG: hypothetical protein NBV76_05260 [Candidatus Ochrobactrum gambitense]|nr:MAG: hypothetical protein NBV76_05260 [Candidatus Ochrobactrum gambitense]WEK17220.1 MAG: hypothetical protein P0Y54_05700 [Candidatus Ochrobactrum gambitense]